MKLLRLLWRRKLWLSVFIIGGLLLGARLFSTPALTPDSDPPSIARIQDLAELVVLRARVDDVLRDEIAGYVGGVEIEIAARGDLLISTDLSKLRYARTDRENRHAVLELPEPTIAWARLDHARSSITSLRRNCPTVGGTDQDSVGFQRSSFPIGTAHRPAPKR